MSSQPDAPSATNLSRYIDRFLFAEGWRVSDITIHETGNRYEVTLTKETGPDRGRSVSRSAPSAGEATFLACGLARHAAIRSEDI